MIHHSYKVCTGIGYALVSGITLANVAFSWTGSYLIGMYEWVLMYLCKDRFDSSPYQRVGEDKKPLGLVIAHHDFDRVDQIEQEAPVGAQGDLEVLQGQIPFPGPCVEARVRVRAHVGRDKWLASKFWSDVFSRSISTRGPEIIQRSNHPEDRQLAPTNNIYA